MIGWPASPEVVRLEPGYAHLWCAPWQSFSRALPRLLALLSADEAARAKRFKFPKDHDSYVIRHGILRVLLGRYLDRQPSEIEFSLGEFGKPGIPAGVSKIPVCFNVSHSGGLALYGFTPDCDIGVDVEAIRPVAQMEKIASRFFSPSETRMLMSVPVTSRLESFFACWTRKEAFLKATGEGIAQNLGNVEVTLVPGDGARISHLHGQPQTQWQLHSFAPAPGYLGCVALPHGHLQLRQWAVIPSGL